MAFKAGLKQLYFRIGVPVGIFVFCAYLLAPHFTGGLLQELPALIADIPLISWFLACCFTIISLWTVGRYDGVAHKHFHTDVSPKQARRAGTISIALAQTLGFGLFTGALARWRMLEQVTLSTSLKLSAFVSVTFMIFLAFTTALACVLFPAPDWTFWPALAILALLPPAIWITFRWPRLTIRTHHFHFPSLSNSSAIFFWTVVDTAAAAAALYVLLPDTAQITYWAFFPIFLISLGVALFSNTPGGVGPFELMMLGALPQLPVNELFSSILAFRIIYYALPALLALLAMIKPYRASRIQESVQKTSVFTAQQAEVQVILQNGGHILQNNTGSSAVWPTGQTVTALCDPLSGSMKDSTSALIANAQRVGKIPLVYKCSAQYASELRKSGWSILHNSDEAIISPQNFDLNTPRLRGLRRKLRAARKNGVTLHVDGHIPWDEMREVDARWQQCHGNARGGTMGRFAPDYLSTHFIARARVNGRLCAFATFQRGLGDWCLDVMRHTNDMPDGTMHALVHAGIMAAKDAGLSRLSLAGTPACPDPDSPFFRWAATQMVIKAGGTGLRQFKSSFAPRWEPRYSAAPSSLKLVIALADVAREVHNPPDLTAPQMQEIHNFDENYELCQKHVS